MQPSKLEGLSEGELLQIHEASLKILSETGMIVLSQMALKLLDEAGAQVDFQKKLVRFPKRLVEDSLDSVPKKFPLYKTRSKEIAFVLGDGETHTGTGGGGIFFLDSKTGKRRKITKSDVAQFIRIADVLPNIDMIIPAGYPQDVAPKATVLHSVDAVLSNTEKPILLASEGLFQIKAVLEIARVISGEEDLSKHPGLICEFSPTSPLSWSGNTVDPLIEAVKSGVPCSIVPMPLPGVSAPFTLAGQLVMHNVEALSGIVISQMIKKGAPIVYAQCWVTFDMKKGTMVFGFPEAALLRMAATRLAKFYEIPVRSAGIGAASPCIDVQNGWESMFARLSTFLISDLDLIVGFGGLDSCLTISNEQLIIDNEIFEIVKRLEKGINVSRETMATEVIQKVGPKGNYLCEEHTLKHLRTGEYWEPVISNRDNYETWTKKGSPSVEENAKEKVEEILRMHTIEPLDQNKQREIKHIIEKFESEIK